MLRATEAAGDDGEMVTCGNSDLGGGGVQRYPPSLPFHSLHCSITSQHKHHISKLNVATCDSVHLTNK